MNELFNNKDEAINFLINMNKMFLDRKAHIKKYYHARKVHASVLNSMMRYIDSGKVPIDKYFNTIVDDIKREAPNLNFELDNREYNDAQVFNELFIYKNHKKIPSITEIYIEKKKFKDGEKIKMLQAMRDSVVGLFKVIDYDVGDGYVTYQDVFTNKKYKIVDVSMSSTGQLIKDLDIYMYSRIINYDGVLFGTGIPCCYTSEDKEFMKFIKSHKYNKCSDFSRCLILYGIFKNSSNSRNMKGYHNF